MKVKVILNPYAGGQGSLERTGDVSRSLVSAGIDYDLVVSRKPGQAKKEALAAAYSSYDAVISAGGDGTVHEVINGLIIASENDPTCQLGILPLGRSNNFGNALHIPQDLFAAAEVIARGNTRYLDAAWVSCSAKEPLNGGQAVPIGCYFNNRCTAAFESILIREGANQNPLRAKLRTLLAVYHYLQVMKPWRARIIWDQGAFEGKITLFSVAISEGDRQSLQDMPRPQPAASLLELIFVPEMSRADLFLMIPYFVLGLPHTRANLIHQRTSAVYIESEPPTPLVADGELIAERAWKANFEVIPNKIKFLSPKID